LFEWTITNGIPKTLPMLYTLYKGQKNTKNEMIDSDKISANHPDLQGYDMLIREFIDKIATQSLCL
jgi:hypothetical protein